MNKMTNLVFLLEHAHSVHSPITDETLGKRFSVIS